jgi:outer membrane protein TolC
VWQVVMLAVVVAGSGQAQEAEPADPPSATPLTLEDCIAIALQNQPAIRAQQAAVGIASEQQKIARSYLLPQVGLTTRLTHLNEPRTVISPNPLVANPLLTDALADGAAFFGIARQLGPAVANLALANPTLPPFSTARQAVLASIPTTFQTDLLGDTFLTNELLLTQPLYTGGKIRYRNEQAKLGIQAADSDLTKTRPQTIFEVSRAYFAVQLFNELIQVAEDTAVEFRAIERLAQSSYDESIESVTSADPRRARSLRLLAESQKVEFERGKAEARAALETAMGLPPRYPLELSQARLDEDSVQLELNELLAKAWAQRPEMIQAELGVRNADLERKLAGANFSPDVGFFASLTTVNDNRAFPNPTNPHEFAVGVQASLPLFEGGRRLAQRRQAGNRQEQAREVLTSVRNLVGLEVQRAYLEYQEMSGRLPLGREAMDEADGAIRSYEAQWTAGAVAKKDRSTYFENRLVTRLLLTQAQVGYYQYLYGYNLALAKIRLVTATDEHATWTSGNRPADGDAGSTPVDGKRATK